MWKYWLQHGLSTGRSPFRGDTSSGMEHLLLWPCCTFFFFSQHLLPILKYIFTEVPQTKAFMCSGSVAKPVGSSCDWQRAVPDLLPQRTSLQLLFPLPPPCHLYTIQTRLKFIDGKCLTIPFLENAKCMTCSLDPAH